MITIYSKSNCPHCDDAKEYFNTNDIPFEAIDVSKDENALLFLKKNGHKTVPQFYVGNTLLIEGGNNALQKQHPTKIIEMTKELSSKIMA